MEESRAVLERLARIEALDAAGGSAAELLRELRALLGEAEAWAGREGGAAGERAVVEFRDALASAQDRRPLAHAPLARENADGVGFAAAAESFPGRVPA